MKVEKEPSGSENVVTLTAQELQSHLWEAANILRGSAVDRTDWKGYILPLLFFKRICDVWDEETSEVADIYGDVVATEHAGPPIEQEDRGKAALTELFEEVRNSDTPVMVERIVGDIDEIVRQVRFAGWQDTHAGEREVRKALRKTLFKYQLHQDVDLFDRAYGYIREHY